MSNGIMHDDQLFDARPPDRKLPAIHVCSERVLVDIERDITHFEAESVRLRSRTSIDEFPPDVCIRHERVPVRVLRVLVVKHRG